MKKFFISAIFLMFSVALFAQPTFDLGLKAGINNSKITFKSSEFTSESVVKAHFGAFSRIGWGSIYIQPEAYFCSKGGKVVERGADPADIAGRFDYSNIDIPVLLGIKVIEGGMANLRVMGGPMFSILTSKEIEGDDLLRQEYYENNYVGFQ